MKYFVKTYGCQMNVHESEKLNGMLESLGYVACDNEKNADIIVFNTCAIRDGVEQKIFGNIGALKSLKKQKKDLIIAVCGCMSQAEGRAKTIKEKFPFVNIIFGRKFAKVKWSNEEKKHPWWKKIFIGINIYST